MFDDVILERGGKDYKIKATDIMPLLAGMEKILTLMELQQAAAENKAPLVAISQCYGYALRYAGCKVSDQQIYYEIVNDKGEDGANAGNAVSSLMALMIPPDDIAEDGGEKKK